MEYQPEHPRERPRIIPPVVPDRFGDLAGPVCQKTLPFILTLPDCYLLKSTIQSWAWCLVDKCQHRFLCMFLEGGTIQ